MRFDSWRLNLQPGVWLPAYVYTEESDSDRGWGQVHMKAQARLWGYDLSAADKRGNHEFTRILVDGRVAKDQSGASTDAAPVAAERMWQHQAEGNALERWEKVELLAPSGDVDTVLQTVISNLVISNNLTLASDVRSRVLITALLRLWRRSRSAILL